MKTEPGKAALWRLGALRAVVVLLMLSLSMGNLQATLAEVSLQDSTPTVRIQPAQSVVGVGQTFTVEVMLDNFSDLGAYEFDMAFDPSVVRVDSVVDGGFLGSTGRQVASVGPEIDNVGGLVSFGAYSWSESDPPEPGPNADDPGTLAIITLTALNPGTTALNLIDETEAAGNPDWDYYCLVADTQANEWPDPGAGRDLNVEDGTVIGISIRGDYDPDATSDIGFFRDGVWGILKSSATPPFDYDDSMWFSWGKAGDTPVVGDFDGDGKADPTVWRPPEGGQSAVHLMLLSGTTPPYDYGQAQFKDSGWPILGDIPVEGDFDGDGKTDVAIWRGSNGVWIIAKSSSDFNDYIFTQWGTTGDMPLP